MTTYNDPTKQTYNTHSFVHMVLWYIQTYTHAHIQNYTHTFKQVYIYTSILSDGIRAIRVYVISPPMIPPVISPW